VDVAGLAVTGPLARTVTDAALLLDVMTATWPGDVAVLPQPEPSFVAATRRVPPRLRVGLLTEPVIASDAVVHPACQAAAENTASLVADLGHHVEPVGVPFPAEAWAAFAAVWSSLAASIPVPAEREGDLRPLTRWLREQGRATSAVDYITAIAGTQVLARQVAQAWAHVDVVLSPTLADLPAPVGALRDDDDPAADFAAQTRFTPWTSVWNLIGRPALSLPLEWADEAGTTLPIGVMLGGAFGADELLFSLAAELEAARPWYHRYDDLWTSLT
jgi:amidase